MFGYFGKSFIKFCKSFKFIWFDKAGKYTGIQLSQG